MHRCLKFASACILAATALAVKLDTEEEDEQAKQKRLKAQVEAFASGLTHTCSEAFDNIQERELPDFASIIAGSEKFTDETFPYEEAIQWIDIDQTPAQPTAGEYYVWERATVAFPDSSLWGSEGITPADFDQGRLSNCYFIATAAALAEEPGRIEKLFLNESNELNEAGIYAVTFYELGAPVTVVVDDYLPLVKEGPLYRSRYAERSPDRGLAGLILEKAFAKFVGNYQRSAIGSSLEAYHALTGNYAEPYIMSEHSLDDVWAAMKKADQLGGAIVATTGSSDDNPNSDAYTNEYGISYFHLYSVLGTAEVDGNRLLKMRNPWGNELYRGPWHDGDTARWTDERKAQVAFEAKNDGVFFMDIDTFGESFLFVTTSPESDETPRRVNYLSLDQPVNQVGEGPCPTCNEQLLS